MPVNVIVYGCLRNCLKVHHDLHLAAGGSSKYAPDIRSRELTPPKLVCQVDDCTFIIRCLPALGRRSVAYTLVCRSRVGLGYRRRSSGVRRCGRPCDGDDGSRRRYANMRLRHRSSMHGGGCGRCSSGVALYTCGNRGSHTRLRSLNGSHCWNGLQDATLQLRVDSRLLRSEDGLQFLGVATDGLQQLHALLLCDVPILRVPDGIRLSDL